MRKEAAGIQRTKGLEYLSKEKLSPVNITCGSGGGNVTHWVSL